MQYDNVPLNLVILAEECGEVLRIVGKCLRFGLDDYHPVNGFPNREALEIELGHLAALTEILVSNNVLRPEQIDAAAHRKLKTLEAWYDHPGGMIGGDA